MDASELVAPAFLFRFEVPCRYRKELWTKLGPATLSEEFVLPSFSQLNGGRPFADVRVAWSEDGMLFVARVAEKAKSIWCREAIPLESDGFNVCIDTRDTHNIHRAGRFCHLFSFLPAGGGKGNADPVAKHLPINRAREEPKLVPSERLKIKSSVESHGYELAAFIPSDALTGYDPSEHPKLGFTYWLSDRELGKEWFTVGSEFLAAEDPSVWGTLHLVKTGV